MSCRPAHAPPGRGTLLASLWDVTWVREMLGLVEAACWMWSRSVFLWPSRNPKPLPGALPGGAAKVRECVGGFICAGLCWGAGPLGCCFSVRAKSNFCHLPVPWFPHLCKTRRRYFSPEMLSKRWFVAGARLKNGNPGACPRVFLTVEWLQRLKCSCSPQGAGQHLALPH